ncbi:MAG: hypothetical protein BRD35_09155 [Bacteroidetes bacterium QH_7_62_13]|jgi:hypothetical protein|nr:MAG: hypothetical protein BRD35_09155 [Bacteroidetes bacterium QH_7_62_13]
MGFFPLTFRGAGLYAILISLLPTVREMAQETLTRAREQYHAGRSGEELVPSVTRLDPVILSSPVRSVSTGRLARLLVDARPMGP